MDQAHEVMWTNEFVTGRDAVGDRARQERERPFVTKGEARSDGGEGGEERAGRHAIVKESI